MLYYLMLIKSENSLLNILIPKDNKVLKEVLKEADAKTLTNSNKSSNEQIIKNLFSKLQNKQPNSDLFKLLKDSSLLKDLGSVSTNVQDLTNALKKEPTLLKFIPQLQNLFKNIDNLDFKSIKLLLENSGLFLESKLEKNLKINNLSKKVETLLEDILKMLSNDNSKESTQVKTLINSLLSNKKNTQDSLTKDLKTIESFLTKLFNQNTKQENKTLLLASNKVHQLLNKGTLLESMQTNKLNVKEDQVNLQKSLKTLLNSLKQELSKNQTSNSSILKEINTLLKQNDLFKNNIDSSFKQSNLKLLNYLENNLSKENNSLSNLSSFKEKINALSSYESKNLNTSSVKENTLLSSIKESLLHIKESLNNVNISSKPEISNLIEKLLSQSNIFSKIDLSSNLLFTSKNNLSNNLQNLLFETKELINSSKDNINKNEILKVLTKVQSLINNENLINKNSLSSDLKANLLNLQQEVNNNISNQSSDLSKIVDKLLTQIDYHQILSLANNSNNLYLPFIWDMLEEGDIEIKENKDEKFVCEINLKLKTLGSINMLLMLYDKNKIDLSLYAQKTDFKNMFKDNLKELKQALNKVGLIPTNFKILDEKKEKKQDKIHSPYDSFKDTSFGINIKV